MTSGYYPYISAVMKTHQEDWHQGLEWFFNQHPLRTTALMNLNANPASFSDTWKICNCTALNVFSFFLPASASEMIYKIRCYDPTRAVGWSKGVLAFQNALSHTPGKGIALYCKIVSSNLQKILHEFVLEETPDNQCRLYQSYLPEHDFPSFLQNRGKDPINKRKFINQIREVVQSTTWNERRISAWKGAFHVAQETLESMFTNLRISDISELQLHFVSTSYAEEDVPTHFEPAAISPLRKVAHYSVCALHGGMRLAVLGLFLSITTYAYLRYTR